MSAVTGDQRVSYREHAPPPALTPWLECLWERRGTGQPVRVLPDGCIDVLWIQGIGAQVAGPNTVAFVAAPPAGAHVVGARLRPGTAGALLDLIEPEGLRDARPSAVDALGSFGAELETSMTVAHRPVTKLGELLLEQAHRAPRPDPLVQEAVEALRRPGVAVSSLADWLGVSERQLRRRVAAAVGYGPKLLGRVLRLQRALDAARTGGELGRVAFDAGYADQAHFCGDCRALTGVNPSRLLVGAEQRGVRFLQDGRWAARDDVVMTTELKLGWVIAYVDEPTAASEFYSRVFGLKEEFAAPDGSYAQLDTGATKLAFASYGLGEKNFPGGVRRAAPDGPPPNVEITLVTDDVDDAFARALQAGCEALAQPEDKPHGQRVAFVRDPFGGLLELGTPM